MNYSKYKLHNRNYGWITYHGDPTHFVSEDGIHVEIADGCYLVYTDRTKIVDELCEQRYYIRTYHYKTDGTIPPPLRIFDDTYPNPPCRDISKSLGVCKVEDEFFLKNRFGDIVKTVERNVWYVNRTRHFKIDSYGCLIIKENQNDSIN